MGTAELAAQTAASDPLEEAVRDALRRSPELAIQRASAAEAIQQVRLASSALRPQATLEGRYTRMRGGLDLGAIVSPAYQTLNDLLGEPRFPTELDLTLPLRHESRLRIVQPLLNRQASAAREAATRRAEGEAAWSVGVARALAAEAQQSLVVASSAREGRRILESALERAAEGERVAERLVEEGVETPLALLQARADRREIQALLEEAESREDASRWALNRITGRPAGTPVPHLDVRLEERETASDAALDTREELLRLDAAIRAAEAGLRAAQAGRLPTVAVAVDPGFQGSRVRFDSDAWSVSASLVVSLPLVTGGATGARIEGARQELARLRWARDHAAEGIALEVRVARRALDAARARIPAAAARLDAAAELHALALRRQEEGLATPLELSEARSLLTAAELGQSLALHERLLAWIELEYAAALRILPPTP